MQTSGIYAVYSSPICPMLHRIALSVVPEWCQYSLRRIHLESRSLCNAQHLAVELSLISSADKIATNDAGPYLHVGFWIRTSEKE